MKKSDRRFAKFAKSLAVLILPLTVSSCVMPGPNKPLPVSVPEAFSDTGVATVSERWWEAFGDSELNRVVEDALRENFTISAAWDRLEQARATARKSGAALWPSVDGSAGAERQVLRSSQTGRDYASDFSLGLTAGYEVDLWGRIGAARDAAVLDAEATAEDLKTARLTISVAVVDAWFRTLEYRMRLGLVDKQVATNEKFLEIIERQFRSGQAAITDVLQQRQVLEARRGGRELILATLKTTENELAVLLGRMPGRGSVVENGRGLPSPGMGFPKVPELPATGVPAEVLKRRPDVRAAELRLASANRDAAVAMAERFPKLRLGLTAQTSDEDVRDLFDNWLANVAADLTAPLFDAGLRKAEVERTRAVYMEQLHTYAQVVLEAVQEVEDALETERRQAAYAASLERQLELSGQALEQTLERYTKGSMSFTRYLTALLDFQTLELDMVSARRSVLSARVSLYRALAGDAGVGVGSENFE
jgi:NodT family efflux transporter outer membrane factor (OMF) lipoprotein